MNSIVITRARVLAEFRALRQRGPNSGVRVAAGLQCADDGGVRWLVSPREPESGLARRSLWLQVTDDLAGVSPRQIPAGCDGALFLGHGHELGQAVGYVQMEPGQIERVGELVLPGPGMETIPLLNEPLGSSGNGGLALELFSRVSGALGDAAFRRLARLRFCIIGAGRLGSTLAHVLARDGVLHLTLIDPDRLEDHNIAGGIGPAFADIGKFKVDALAVGLREVHPAIQVEALSVSVTSLRALDAVAAADIVITTPDDDAARIAASLLATLFLKPLLDVGTAIWEDGPNRRMGIDVRIVYPGRCLPCAGGVRTEAAARAILASAEAEEQARLHPRDWRELRAGSLTSLNTVGAGLAARALENFVTGTLTENGWWLRAEFNRAEEPRLFRVHPGPRGHCFCDLAGLGEDGLEAAIERLHVAPGEPTTRHGQ